MCPHCRKLGYRATPRGYLCVACELVTSPDDWKRAGETRAAMRRDQKAQALGPKSVIERRA